MPVTTRQFALYVLFMALLHHISSLWSLWSSVDDAIMSSSSSSSSSLLSPRESNDAPSLTDDATRRGEGAGSGIGRRTPSLRGNGVDNFGGAYHAHAHDHDVPYEFPTLAQIDQASVVLKRGTKVYLDFISPRPSIGDGLGCGVYDDDVDDDAYDIEMNCGVFTVAIAAVTDDLTKLFGGDGDGDGDNESPPRPSWGGGMLWGWQGKEVKQSDHHRRHRRYWWSDMPLSVAVQVSDVSRDVESISAVVNGNPRAFRNVRIHLVLSEAMLVADWTSIWSVAVHGARTDLVLALPDVAFPSPSSSSSSSPASYIGGVISGLEAVNTVQRHYASRLNMGKLVLRIKEGGVVGGHAALLVSKRGGLLPLPGPDKSNRSRDNALYRSAIGPSAIAARAAAAAETEAAEGEKARQRNGDPIEAWEARLSDELGFAPVDLTLTQFTSPYDDVHASKVKDYDFRLRRRRRQDLNENSGGGDAKNAVGGEDVAGPPPSRVAIGNMYVTNLDSALTGSFDVAPGLIAYANFISPVRRQRSQGRGRGRRWGDGGEGGLRNGAATEPPEVTLVTQFAFDKRNRLIMLASVWGGYVSAAVHLPSLSDVEPLVRFVRNNHRSLQMVALHIVVGTIEHYPINLMRNIATDAAIASPNTDFIFTVDLDFMPSLEARNVIRSYVTHPFWGKQVMMNSRAAMVVPAFEYDVNGMSDSEMFGSMPLTKSELRRSNDVLPFHVKWFPKGHSATDFDRWYGTDEPYEVRYEEGFEPYVVLCARGGHGVIPSYWEGFQGYKLNKLSWIRELDEAGYRFYVMPGEAFIIHMAHDISTRKEMPGLMKEKEKFASYLQQRYARA